MNTADTDTFGRVSRCTENFCQDVLLLRALRVMTSDVVKV